jgi:enoyl-CoA hydratase/carnithine racemase
MKYETIVTDKKEHIGFLTLNRPEDGNRQTMKMCEEIMDALKKFDHDSEVRVVVINANGKNFSLGMSLEDFKGKSSLVHRELLQIYDAMQASVADFPKATVVAVQGVCVAGGAGLAMRGDITIMEEDAQFGVTAINVGLSCMKGIRYVERIIGQKKALEMMLTGQTWSAKDAERFGFINRIAPKGELMEVAMESANLLASKSPTAVRFTKMANSQTRDMSISDATRFLSEHFCLLLTSEDAQEGIKAFEEGRKPVWKRK